MGSLGTGPVDQKEETDTAREVFTKENRKDLLTNPLGGSEEEVAREI